MKTSKDTVGTKLKSANENYGYRSDEPKGPPALSGWVWTAVRSGREGVSEEAHRTPVLKTSA